ncbi:hypothetical protein ACTXT7_012369 [Hymenolepis weldensis]
MMGGYMGTDPTEVPTVMHAHEVFSNNYGLRWCEGHNMTPHFRPQSLRINADAYVEIPQTIVKPLWMDSVANGGPYVFPKEIRLHPRKLSKLRIG